MLDTEGVYLVVPAYNEEKHVETVLRDISKLGYHIILVNDGSKDNTLEIARSVQKDYPNQIYIVSHIINRGLGAALKTGMTDALKHNAKYIITFDADGQHAFEDIPKVLKPLQDKKVDAVIGSRIFEDMPTTKRFANNVMNILTHIFYGIKVKDSQSGLRAFSSEAAKKIDVVSAGYGVSSEFIKEIKNNQISFDEVPITTIYTDETQHKGTNAIVGIKIMFKMIGDLFR
ncbi:MAG: glycosyltransferase family 2 protein [Methanobrevibacter wolinii]|uniref:glycosyltransferase family 2 protein n=1 Tax=Methanobrevibacter wolinii TaxID=190977 RepID=UPI0005B2599B|nr:glycosyltransferase family 2 protein [Methanobrevibacter wolinii]MDD5960574.1 glycosyltransferase family 2 protein [Methanobrevibacter wolinii]